MYTLFPGDMVLDQSALNGNNHETFCEFVAAMLQPDQYNLEREKYRITYGFGENGKPFKIQRTRVHLFSIRQELAKKFLKGYRDHAKDMDAIKHPYLTTLWQLERENQYQPDDLESDDEDMLDKPVVNRVRKHFDAVCRLLAKQDLPTQRKMSKRIICDLESVMRYYASPPCDDSSQELQFHIVRALRGFIQRVSLIHELRFSRSCDVFPRVDTDSWCIHMKEDEPREATGFELMKQLRALHVLRQDDNICFKQKKGGSFMGKGAASLSVWMKSARGRF
jgi:hypothetical protein